MIAESTISPRNELLEILLDEISKNELEISADDGKNKWNGKFYSDENRINLRLEREEEIKTIPEQDFDYVDDVDESGFVLHVRYPVYDVVENDIHIDWERLNYQINPRENWNELHQKLKNSN